MLNDERVEKENNLETKTRRIMKESTSLRRSIDLKYARREDERDWTAVEFLTIYTRKIGKKVQSGDNRRAIKII